MIKIRFETKRVYISGSQTVLRGALGQRIPAYEINLRAQLTQLI